MKEYASFWAGRWTLCHRSILVFIHEDAQINHFIICFIRSLKNFNLTRKGASMLVTGCGCLEVLLWKSTCLGSVLWKLERKLIPVVNMWGKRLSLYFGYLINSTAVIDIKRKQFSSNIWFICPNFIFRKYLPEVRNLPTEFIFEPWLAPCELQESCGCMIGRDYPAPIVNHLEQRVVCVQRLLDLALTLTATWTFN